MVELSFFNKIVVYGKFLLCINRHGFLLTCLGRQGSWALGNWVAGVGLVVWDWAVSDYGLQTVLVVMAKWVCVLDYGLQTVLVVMANYKTVVSFSFIISHPFKKFKGTFFTHSSLFSSRNLSSFLEVGTGPKATVAPFDSNSCSTGQKLFNRRRSVFDKITNRDDALKLFHEMANWQPLPSVARFTKLLQAVTKTRDSSCSVELFQRMNCLGVPADSRTVSIVIKCLSQMHRTSEGFAVLGYGYKYGVEPDVVVLSTLLDGLILENKVLEAEAFFKKLVKEEVCEPTAVMYTNMIKGLCKFGLNDAAIDFLKLMGESDYATNVVTYKQMVDEALKLFRETVFHKGIKPDVVTYSSLLYSLYNLSRQADISNLLIELEDSGCLNLEIRNIFVHVYCKLGRMEDAERIVKLMFYPGLDTYKALIDGYSSLGEVNKARHYFDLLRSRGMNVNVHTYNTLLKGHFKDHLYVEEAIRLFHDMSKQGVEPNLTTYHTMLEGFFQVGRWSRGRKVFNEMLEHSQHYLRPNILTYRIVLEGLCDNNKLEEALSLFHSMGNNELNSEIVLYNILIDGANNSGRLDTARNLFNDLSIKGLQPDAKTYTLMITGFCLEGLVEEAKQLFLEMKEKGFRPDRLSCNLLLRGLLKIEQLDIAEEAYPGN